MTNMHESFRSVVAGTLVARGHDVPVLDDMSDGCIGKIMRCAGFLEGSITDADLMQRSALMAVWMKYHGARASREFKHIEIEQSPPGAWRRTQVSNVVSPG